MPRHCLAVDLVNDPAFISEYDDYHKKVWPEIIKSLHDSGIVQMDIYRVENRLFMVIDTTDDFTFGRKASMDAANPMVQKWEAMMGKYQQAIPGTKPGSK